MADSENKHPENVGGKYYVMTSASIVTCAAKPHLKTSSARKMADTHSSSNNLRMTTKPPSARKPWKAAPSKQSAKTVNN